MDLNNGKGFRVLHLVATAGTFLLFALMFTVPSGYSYGSVLLLIASLWSLAYRGGRVMQRRDAYLMGAFLFYFLVMASSTALLGNTSRWVDLALRALLAIPILLMLRNVAIDLRAIWGGAALGSLLAGALSVWQFMVSPDGRAHGFTNAIHFGDLMLLLGVFCLAGTIWLSSLGRPMRWRVFCMAGLFAALVGVVLSGSRGAWSALPALALVFVVAFFKRRNIKWIVLVLSIAVIGVAAISLDPNGVIQERYRLAVNDITQYEQGHVDTSIGMRFEMWRGALHALRERPLTGWNEADYARLLEAQVRAGTLPPDIMNFADNLHNNFLQAWVFNGLLGLIALVAVFLVPFCLFGRRLRDRDVTVRIMALCGCSVPIAYLCFSMTQAIMQQNNGVIFYFMTLCIFWGVLRVAEEHREQADPARLDTVG